MLKKPWRLYKATDWTIWSFPLNGQRNDTEIRNHLVVLSSSLRFISNVSIFWKWFVLFVSVFRNQWSLKWDIRSFQLPLFCFLWFTDHTNAFVANSFLSFLSLYCWSGYAKQKAIFVSFSTSLHSRYPSVWGSKKQSTLEVEFRSSL
jgi:hypothetical protein